MDLQSPLLRLSSAGSDDTLLQRSAAFSPESMSPSEYVARFGSWYGRYLQFLYVLPAENKQVRSAFFLVLFVFMFGIQLLTYLWPAMDTGLLDARSTMAASVYVVFVGAAYIANYQSCYNLIRQRHYLLFVCDGASAVSLRLRTALHVYFSVLFAGHVALYCYFILVVVSYPLWLRAVLLVVNTIRDVVVYSTFLPVALLYCGGIHELKHQITLAVAAANASADPHGWSRLEMCMQKILMFSKVVRCMVIGTLFLGLACLFVSTLLVLWSVGHVNSAMLVILSFFLFPVSLMVGFGAVQVLAAASIARRIRRVVNEMWLALAQRAQRETVGEDVNGKVHAPTDIVDSERFIAFLSNRLPTICIEHFGIVFGESTSSKYFSLVFTLVSIAVSTTMTRQ